MGAIFQQEKNGLWVLRIFGALRKQELDTAQTDGLKVMSPSDEAKLLVMIGEDFAGWVGGEIWGDMKFFYDYGDRISKIAIVGDPKWETRMLMFTGAGLRRAPVKFFSQDQLAEAQTWLSR